MRAVVIHETGGPEVLRIEDVPKPEAGEGEVLVQVEAAGVNRFDLNQRAGGASKLPLVLSSIGDAAGTRMDTGERVVLTGGRGTVRGADVRQGREHRAAAGRRGLPGCGCVPGPLPGGVVGCRREGRVARGRDAARSGRREQHGTGGNRPGRSLGAKVYATASSSKHDRLRDLGAEPLAYDDERLDDLGADVVFDPLGRRTFGRSLEALGRNGRLVTPGAVGDSGVALDVWQLVGKRARIEGIAAQDAPPETLARLVELLAGGLLHPWVEKELPLEEAAEAHRLIESGEVVGRVVLVP